MTKTPAGGFDCTLAQGERCYNQWGMEACCTSLCFGCLAVIEMEENCYSQIVKDWKFTNLKLLWNNFAAMDRSIQVSLWNGSSFVEDKSSVWVTAPICISYICLASKIFICIFILITKKNGVVTLLISDFYNHVEPC